MANTLVSAFALDNTSITTLRAWAGATAYTAGLPTAGGISYAMSTLGWVQTNDTGQVAWIASVLTSTVTAVTVTGGNAVYTYSALTSGPALRVGMFLTISGFGNALNNVTGVITAIAAGTFTLATTTQVTQAGQTASATNPVASVFTTTITSVTVAGGNATYAYSAQTSGPIPQVGMFFIITGMATAVNNCAGTITSVVAGVSFTMAATTQATTTQSGSATTSTPLSIVLPLANEMVYEIWRANDALSGSSPIFLKFEYGSAGTSSNPNFTIIAGQASDGGGNISGLMTSIRTTVLNGISGSAGNDTTARNHFFCGTAGRISMALNNNAANSSTIHGHVNIERSHDSSGSDTGSYFTMLTSGFDGSSQKIFQVSLVNGLVGGPPAQETKWLGACPTTADTTWTYNSTTAIAVINPFVGVMGNPVMNFLLALSTDWADISGLTITLYGASHNYIVMNGNASKNTYTSSSTSNLALLLRWE